MRKTLMSDRNNESILPIILTAIGAILPFYAAYKDYQFGEDMLSLMDIILFPLGIIRGLMYLFG